MATYYEVLTSIKDTITDMGIVKSITKGSIDQFTTLKKHQYPASHVIVNNFQNDSHSKVYNISIIFMDIVDISKENITDLYLGNNNEDDVINSMMLLADRFFEIVRRGAITDTIMVIEDESMQGEMFVDRFEDMVAGVTVTFNLNVDQTMSIC